MSTQMDYKLRKIWNVIATIPGTDEPDRWIMLGNHRDAWVYGAVDPSSGTAATMETCRPSLKPSSTAGSRVARWSMRAGTPRNTDWSARPSGPRPTPTN